jgi:hypothetical protein
MVTPPKPAEDLKGLVYGMVVRGERDREETGSWWQRPGLLAAVLLAGGVILTVVFW